MNYLALREDNPKYPSVIGIRATLWTSTYDLVDRTMVIRYWEDGYKEHRLRCAFRSATRTDFMTIR